MRSMHRPPALTRDQTRRVDQLAIDQYGISSMVLMENAGRGVVDVLLDVDSQLAASTGETARVAIFCGKGNNAGDGLVIARHLAIRGVSAQTLLLYGPEELQGDALSNYQVLSRCELPIIELADELATIGDDANDANALFDEHAGGAAWLIDAMLGTGATGEPRSPVDVAIAWMNRQAARRLAVDVPSGLDCDSGKPADKTLRADVTCTFVAPKIGFEAPAAAPLVGQLRVVSIGTPPRLLQQVLDEVE